MNSEGKESGIGVKKGGGDEGEVKDQKGDEGIGITGTNKAVRKIEKKLEEKSPSQGSENKEPPTKSPASIGVSLRETQYLTYSSASNETVNVNPLPSEEKTDGSDQEEEEIVVKAELNATDAPSFRVFWNSKKEDLLLIMCVIIDKKRHAIKEKFGTSQPEKFKNLILLYDKELGLQVSAEEVAMQKFLMDNNAWKPYLIEMAQRIDETLGEQQMEAFDRAVDNIIESCGKTNLPNFQVLQEYLEFPPQYQDYGLDPSDFEELSQELVRINQPSFMLPVLLEIFLLNATLIDHCPFILNNLVKNVLEKNEEIVHFESQISENWNIIGADDFKEKSNISQTFTINYGEGLSSKFLDSDGRNIQKISFYLRNELLFTIESEYSDCRFFPTFHEETEKNEPAVIETIILKSEGKSKFKILTLNLERLRRDPNSKRLCMTETELSHDFLEYLETRMNKLYCLHSESKGRDTKAYVLTSVSKNVKKQSEKNIVESTVVEFEAGEYTLTNPDKVEQKWAKGFFTIDRLRPSSRGLLWTDVFQLGSKLIPDMYLSHIDYRGNPVMQVWEEEIKLYDRKNSERRMNSSSRPLIRKELVAWPVLAQVKEGAAYAVELYCRQYEKLIFMKRYPFELSASGGELRSIQLFWWTESESEGEALWVLVRRDELSGQTSGQSGSVHELLKVCTLRQLREKGEKDRLIEYFEDVSDAGEEAELGRLEQQLEAFRKVRRAVNLMGIIDNSDHYIEEEINEEVLKKLDKEKYQPFEGIKRIVMKLLTSKEYKFMLLCHNFDLRNRNLHSR